MCLGSCPPKPLDDKYRAGEMSDIPHQSALVIMTRACRAGWSGQATVTRGLEPRPPPLNRGYWRILSPLTNLYWGASDPFISELSDGASRIAST